MESRFFEAALFRLFLLYYAIPLLRHKNIKLRGAFVYTSLFHVGASVGALIYHLKELFLVDFQGFAAFERYITHLAISRCIPSLRRIYLTFARSTLAKSWVELPRFKLAEK